MTLQRRSFTSLPVYLQTPRNNLELAVTDDVLYEPEQAKFVSGFIGDTSKLSATDLARTPVLVENTALQQKYQYTVGVAQKDPIELTFLSGAFYDDLVNHLYLNGAIVTDPNRIFGAYYYAWSPPIDYDKILNPADYYWTGPGTAKDSGEYITKEAAGSQTKIFQYDGSALNSIDVTIVNGLPGSGTTDQIVEDASTTERLFYQWNGAAWGLIDFLPSADTLIKSSYFANDFIYVCRTGHDHNRPVIWVYRPKVGRWVSVPVVINIDRPETPLVGMIWEDTTVPPARTFRIWNGDQWLVLENGSIDPFTGEAITYTAAAGPSGIPSVVTYLYDTRTISSVDSWSARNWWRSLGDLSLSDVGALANGNQGSRPIIEFWGNLEPAAGDTRTSRNQFPKFKLYAAAAPSYQVQPINTTNFPGLDTSINYVGGNKVSTIFQYELGTGVPDSILGFSYKVDSNGYPLFSLTLESDSIIVSGDALLGYRYFKDTTTGYVHGIWERTGQVLLQTADDNGLYDVPKNLRYNPDHVVTTEVSRANFINHFTSVMKSQVDFSGAATGPSNYRYTEKDLTLGAQMIDPEESLQRVMSVLQTQVGLDIPDAIRQMLRDYNKVMVRFVQQLNAYWNDGTISTPTDALNVTATQACDAVLSQIFQNRNAEFPYYYSVMGTYVNTRIVQGTVYVYDTTPQPIYIPNSAAQIGASPPFTPEIFTDVDGVSKIRGHDGSLIPAYGDARDDVILNLENRFFASVQDYMKLETTSFSARFASTFHLDDFYGNFTPNLTAGTVVEVVSDYTSIGSPTVGDRLYSIQQQVFVTWDGTRWLTVDIQTNDVFKNQDDGLYYIFNGFFTLPIETWNRNFSFDYSENEYRSVIQREFERWIVLHDLDFITNNDYDPNDNFTWNFSSAGVEGNWRGIYRRIYRTIRPHSHPWEVVGYSVMPTWWLTSYVPTSYASDGTPRYANTHVMWTDFQNGVVNPLSALTLAAHAMIAPIPVDVNGELLDPITAGVIDESALTPSSLGDDWAYGDGAPVEQSFYDSYYYPFAVALAGYLMKNAMFVDRTWSEYYREIGDTGANIIWNGPHIVFNNTLTRPMAASVDSQLSLDSDGNVVQNPGLNAWIAEYTNIIGHSANNDFDQAIKNCQAALGWKASGFINSKRTKIELLNGDEIPNEDINVVLHQGPSTNEYFQSGIIIVRDTDGFRVFGTDVLNPYFTVDIGAKPFTGGSIETIDTFYYGYYLSDTTISLSGGNYTINDVVTVSGGTFTTAATIKITNVDDNGSPTAIVIVNGGAYSVKPNANVLTVTGGTGTGLKITPTFTLTTRTFTTTNVTVPPVTNDTATFSIIVNGYRVLDKYITRINSTSFSIDPVLILSPGDKIVASVVTTVSNPSTQLGSFTVNGTQITYFQTGTGTLVNYSYGHLFETLSDVVNMMVGHGRYLANQGWVFERLTNGVLRDWLGAAKSFALWSTDLTKQFNGNPSLMKGQIFQISVMGRYTQFNAPFGMILGVEDIRNGSYGVVDVNGKPIRANHLDVTVVGDNITVASDDTDIFGLRLYVSIVQHVVFFPNTTTFGDIIYEPAYGQAQDVMIVDTYRTTNWTGRLEAPGFLIGNGQISQPPPGYAPTPIGVLMPNWEKQVSDVTRYYNRFNPPDDPVLAGMARALFGYVPQNYMDELAIDDRNQFNFFHGSLKAKGTFQPYEAFIRGTTIGTDNATISEDWAWKFARYGDHRQVRVLFNVNEVDWVDIFQAIHFDELEFSYSFTGDEHTACFAIPRRFPPDEAVVTIDGKLQIYGLDYQMTPYDLGYNCCFTYAPLRNTAIVVEWNDVLVHAAQVPFYQFSLDTFLELPVSVLGNNVLLSLNGQIQISGTDYSGSLNTIYYMGELTAYGMAFGNVGANIFEQVFYYGDGFTTSFSTGLTNQTLNTLLVAKNSLLLAPGVDYTIDGVTDAPIDMVQFTSTPNLNDTILIIAILSPENVRSSFATFTGNGSQTVFPVSGVHLTSFREVLVSVDGLVQVGAIPDQDIPYVYHVSSGNVVFETAPASGAVINIYTFLGAAAYKPIPLEDDRVIHIPQFTPPVEDNRWVIPPQQDLYRDQPYHFPVVFGTADVDFSKYLYTAALVDQSAVSPAITMFHWDPARGLHEPYALSLTDYQTPYDPARYNVGPLAESVTNGLVWGAQQTGQIWWDTSRIEYSDYEGFLPDYMRVTREWGKLKYFNATIVRDNEVVTVTTYDPKTGATTHHGLVDGQNVKISGADQPTYNGTFAVTVASDTTFTFIVTVEADTPGTGNIIVDVGMIKCYEWVASPVLPTAWNTFVLSGDNGDKYTGTVLNPDNPSYVSQEIWDVNGNSTITYYFWVENNTRIIPHKNISVNDIEGRLTNPAQYEVPFFGIIDPATIFCFVGDTVVLDNYAVEITYYWYEMPQHIEWILFGEGDDFADIPLLVTDKIVDSMLGEDVHGNPVPNATLAPDEKYGTCFFPAQTVFQDATAALTSYVEQVNALLAGTDIVNIAMVRNGLASADEYPTHTNGYWQKITWWNPDIDHTVVYDTVISDAEFAYLTSQNYYTKNDIIKLIESPEVDGWDLSTQVPAYYQFSGFTRLTGDGSTTVFTVTDVDLSYVFIDGIQQTVDTDYTIEDTTITFTVAPANGTVIFVYTYNLVGIENHAVEINNNIINNSTTFRDFFRNLMGSITKIEANRILFGVLYEMVRQNPTIDWFFKTSYIDIHTTLDIPMTPYVFPDQAAAITEAVLNLKPYRTKLRDHVNTYIAPTENICVDFDESQLDKVTLIFDRVACDLTDENSWDTIPWDATATYPETDTITIPFLGNGVQRCFIIPETVPQEELFVFVNDHLAIPGADYLIDPVNSEICFNVAPDLGDEISVVIDGPYEYIADFEYSFTGDGSKNSEVLPDRVGETHAGDVLTTWNGVHQIPTTDFVIQVTSDVEVVYNSTPTNEIEVNGTVFGGVMDDVFIQTTSTGDGSTTSFNSGVEGLTLDSAVVFIDGIWQTPGTTYTIDDVSNPPNSDIAFVVAPASGAKVVIYAAANSDWVDCSTFAFTGDGSTTVFAISGLDTVAPPRIFVNIDGIQQNQDGGDYIIDSTGVVFDVPPQNDTDIAIFVFWTGIGRKLQASAFPLTIQWDWAYWNYADLGRQEYDFAAFFLGDGITESFTLPIPQHSSLLYNVVIKYFQNGVLLSSTLNNDGSYTIPALGLTYRTVKLATSVVVFLSGPVPSDTYGALYLSRGVYEGLEPTFGYQDPNGVVFAPEPSSYQHFFARLISADFDPSVDMVGCPNHAPEERFQTVVEDEWTIACKIYTELFLNLSNNFLTGVSAVSGHGDFTFFMESSPTLGGVRGLTEVGSFIVEVDPDPLSLNGNEAISAVGVLGVEAGVNLGIEALAEFGTFAFAIDTNPGLGGVEALSEIPTDIQDIDPVDTGVEAISEIGNISSGNITLLLTGVNSTTQYQLFGHQDVISNGQEVISEFGGFDFTNVYILNGEQGISQVGSIIPNIMPAILGAGATTGIQDFGQLSILTGQTGFGQVGTLGVSSDATPSFNGQETTTDVGSLSIDIAPDMAGQAGFTDVGSFFVELSQSPTVNGQEGVGEVGFFGIAADTNPVFVGEEAVSAISMIIDVEPTMAGQSGSTDVGSFFIELSQSPTLTGVTAMSNIGAFTLKIQRGMEVTSAIGSLIPLIEPRDIMPGLAASTQVASMNVNITPILPQMNGQQTTSQVGVLQVGVGF